MLPIIIDNNPWNIEETFIEKDKLKNPPIYITVKKVKNKASKLLEWEIISLKWKSIVILDDNKKINSNLDQTDNYSWMSKQELFNEIEYDKKGNLISHPDFEIYLWDYVECLPNLKEKDKTMLIWILQFLVEDNWEKVNINLKWENIEENTLNLVQFFIQNLAELMEALETRDSSVFDSYNRTINLLIKLKKDWIKINNFILKQMKLYWELCNYIS